MQGLYSLISAPSLSSEFRKVSTGDFYIQPDVEVYCFGRVYPSVLSAVAARDR